MTDRRDERSRGSTDVFGLLDGLSALGPTPLGDVAMELGNGLERFGLDPGIVEETLDGVAVPDAGELDVETAVRPDGILDGVEPDTVVDADGDAVDVAIQGSGETASVLVDAGGDVIEVTTDGGEAATEATAEVLVAALEGL
ncbi:hypothetical protein [Halorientalis halophila]|uniref:hypothetical protein n=1 Tax=Halorientalis halophila TaxID=3108499 RepID=UPI0030086BBC